jgi:gas vesicle protein
MKASTFFVGLATGATVGAVVTLFSTPQSGSELRSSVRTASTDMKGKLSEVKVKLADLKDSIANLTKESKEQIPEIIEGVTTSIQTWKTETSPIQERLQNEISAIQSSIEQLERTISKQPKGQESV